MKWNGTRLDYGVGGEEVKRFVGSDEAVREFLSRLV
jgi:hypothetical protein